MKRRHKVKLPMPRPCCKCDALAELAEQMPVEDGWDFACLECVGIYKSYLARIRLESSDDSCEGRG